MGFPGGIGTAAAAGVAGGASPVGRTARPDPVAAALLIVAGAVGIWQLLLPWRTAAVGTGSRAGGDVSVSGWQVYRLLRSVPDPAGGANIGTYCVLGTAVGGGALIVLGITLMMAINHRPLGLAALLVSLLLVAGAGWMLIQARALFDVGLFTLFAQAQLGWYLFLAAGLVGLAGAWKALATG